jgi:protein CpxP
MKKQLLTIATLAYFSFVSTPVFAQLGPHENPMRSFANLNLSDEQKQEMKAIFKATRENNNVYAGEKKEIRIQMQDLMNMPSWDQATAESIIRSQLEQSQNMALNRAKARNQVYNLLSDEQKISLAAKAEEKEEKSANNGQAKNGDTSRSRRKGKGKGRKMESARLSRALVLSEAQIKQFKAIDVNAKQQIMGLKEQSKAHRESMKVIIQSSIFDESAWFANQSNAINDKVAFKLIKTKAHYDRASLLSDEQKEKLTKVMKMMKNKHPKVGFI